MKLVFAALLACGCVGTLPGGANTPATLAPSTTLAHCVALDVESDWLPPVGAGLGAAGTGLGALAIGQDKPSLTLKITEVSLVAAGLIATGVGMAASKSWHDQCVPRETVVLQTAPGVAK
jgi:hypothetical protein